MLLPVHPGGPADKSKVTIEFSLGLPGPAPAQSHQQEEAHVRRHPHHDACDDL